jgi:hypothetical protein
MPAPVSVRRITLRRATAHGAAFFAFAKASDAAAGAPEPGGAWSSRAAYVALDELVEDDDAWMRSSAPPEKFRVAEGRSSLAITSVRKHLRRAAALSAKGRR